MGTHLPPEKGHIHPTQFLAHVCYGQTVGWINMPLGTEVNVESGDVVDWAEVYLRTKWHLDPFSRLVTIEIGGDTAPLF